MLPTTSADLRILVHWIFFSLHFLYKAQGQIPTISLEYAPAIQKLMTGLQEYFLDDVGSLCTRDFAGNLVIIGNLVPAAGVAAVPLWAPAPGTPEHAIYVAAVAQALTHLPLVPPPQVLTAHTFPTLNNWQIAYPRHWNYRPGTPPYAPGGGRHV